MKEILSDITEHDAGEAALTKNRLKSCRPEIDLTICNGCGGCVEVAPEIFRFNEAAGFLEVADLDYYDPELVDEAVRMCPEDAIKSGEE